METRNIQNSGQLVICDLCYNTYKREEAILIPICSHQLCKQCATTYFTKKIVEDFIFECICPICKQPKELDFKYNVECLSRLKPLLENFLPQSFYEIFDKKRRIYTMIVEEKSAGHHISSKYAEIVIHLMDIEGVNMSHAIKAVKIGGSLRCSLSRIMVTCELCSQIFHPRDISTLPTCDHSFCVPCLRTYFTFQILEFEIKDCTCPSCHFHRCVNTGNIISSLESIASILKNVLEWPILEIFHWKLQDFIYKNLISVYLKTEPRFCSWCSAKAPDLDIWCGLCEERYAEQEIIRLPCCLATCCRDCAQVFFAVQVRKDNIRDSFCPLCDTFHLTHYNGKIIDYLFKMMAILQDILDMQSYELFYKKYQSLNLICSKYCGQCYSKFDANPNESTTKCPKCGRISCFKCCHIWSLEHENLSCQEYTRNNKIYFHPTTNLIETFCSKCPLCKTVIPLSCNPDPYVVCFNCDHEFCYYCFTPYSYGEVCKISKGCSEHTLHVHHPKNCPVLLYEEDPLLLQQLLKYNEVEFMTSTMFPDVDKSINSVHNCVVIFKSESDNCQCFHNAEIGYAGLCRDHYALYLSKLIYHNNLDVSSFTSNGKA